MIDLYATNHFIVYTKEDLANPNMNQRLINYYNGQDPMSKCTVMSLYNAKTPGIVTGKMKNQLEQLVERLCQFKRITAPPAPKTPVAEEKQAGPVSSYQDKDEWTVIRERKSVLSLVVGLPNCGKSSLINALTGGKKTAGVASKPAWTRGMQVYRVTPKLNRRQGIKLDQIDAPQFATWIVDSPGIMIPHRLEKERGYKLAICGNILDSTIQDSVVTTGEYLYQLLKHEHASSRDWLNFLQLEDIPNSYTDLLKHIQFKYGKGDEQGQAFWFVNAFRQGQLGRLTLDKIPKGTRGSATVL